MKTDLSEFYKSLKNSGIVGEKIREEIIDFAEQLNSINLLFQTYFECVWSQFSQK